MSISSVQALRGRTSPQYISSVHLLNTSPQYIDIEAKMAGMISKGEAVKGFIRAKVIQEAGGSTLHLGSRYWRLGSSSGAPFSEPVRAAYMTVEEKFGKEKARIIANTVDELGDNASLDNVKELYNLKMKFVPTAKAVLAKSKSKPKRNPALKISKVKREEPEVVKFSEAKTSTPKEDSKEILEILQRMETKMTR